jgi:hypothetical protein
MDFIAALTEGCSIRATERLTSIHRDNPSEFGLQGILYHNTKQAHFGRISPPRAAAARPSTPREASRRDSEGAASCGAFP